MVVVVSNCPPADAPRIAHHLVEEALAACVNIYPEVRSVYRWRDQLCDEDESTLVMKVPAERREQLVKRLIELHPHDVPEILVFPVDTEASHPPYVAWVRSIGAP
jgi:periplasmic divalent cation tolerance protein